MNQSQLNEPKPQFSGHQTFPLRQLWLKKAYTAIISENPNGAPKSIFTDNDSIVRFGVGKNMVQSINHWALASDFIEDSNNTYKATSIADLLFGNNGLDTYQETIATSWLIHWKLAGEARKTTTWYWLFNKLTNPILEKEFLIKNLFSFAEKLQSKTSLTTLRRDLDCCLRSYVPSEGNVTPEELSESVLGDLGILRQISRGKYEFVRGEKDSLPQGIFVYALLKFWEMHSRFSGQESLSFSAIAHEDRSPGRVFKLDEASIAERLSQLEDFTQGKLIWTDSQGIRTVSRRDNMINPDAILRLAYE